MNLYIIKYNTFFNIHYVLCTGHHCVTKENVSLTMLRWTIKVFDSLFIYLLLLCNPTKASIVSLGYQADLDISLQIISLRIYDFCCWMSYLNNVDPVTGPFRLGKRHQYNLSGTFTTIHKHWGSSRIQFPPGIAPELTYTCIKPTSSLALHITKLTAPLSRYYYTISCTTQFIFRSLPHKTSTSIYYTITDIHLLLYFFIN